MIDVILLKVLCVVTVLHVLETVKSSEYFLLLLQVGMCMKKNS